MTATAPASGELCQAIRNWQLEDAERLLDRGADPNERYSRGNGETALHLALIFGNFSLVKQLVEKGAELETADNAGVTPLMYAARYNDTPAIMLLIDEGVCLDTKDNKGATALTWAHDEGKEILKGAPKLRQQRAEDEAVREAAEAERKRKVELHNTATTRQEILKNLRPKMVVRPS